MGEKTRSRPLWRRTLKALRILLFPAVVVAVFVGILPRIANLDRVWSVISSMSSAEVAVLVALAVLNLVTYWPMLVAAMPGLSLGQAAVVCQSSTTVAMTVPAGGAVAVGVSYAMYTSWGFSRAKVALSALATFVANMSYKLLLPAISLGLLAATGGAPGDELPAALVGLGGFLAAFGVLALMLRSERFARRAGKAASAVASWFLQKVGRPPTRAWGDTAVRFRARVIDLLRTRGLFLAAAEVVSQLAVYLVLLASVRFTGTPDSIVSWAQVLVVFAFIRLATAMPIIPGNVGIAELGYIGGLVVAGSGRTQAVAAVLVFRFLTYFAQIPIGGLTYLVWRRRTHWRAPAQGSRDEQAEGMEADGQGPGGTGHAMAETREHEGHPA
ncbi:MAG TPA: YbhN family protein [Actinomycetota bacterium]